MPNWIDGQRARCGPLTDAASIFAAYLGVERDPPRGVHGLVAVTRALSAHQHKPAVDESEERMLIELAGSYLAVVLCDGLQQGQHVSRAGRHGLQLGTRGFFDPFAAVETAVEADDVRACLCESIATAEAEACDRGPVARVVREIERQLQALPRSVEIRARFGAELELACDGIPLQLDARTLLRACEGESDAVVQGAVRKLLDALPELRAPLSFAEAEPEVLPRLVGPRFLRGLLAKAGRHALCSVPLAGEVRIAYLLRGERRARYVHEQDLRGWQRDLPALHAAALRNLARSSTRARMLRADGDEGAFVLARTGDGLDSCRVLLPALHALLCSELGSPCAVGIPHRDALLCCPLDDARALFALRARVQHEATRASHAISAGLFSLHADGTLAPLAP